MVNVPQVTIPDFAGTLARGEQVQASRLQALLARQGMEESQRFNAGLAELAPALATGEGPTYDSALARLVGLGRQGAALGLPLLTDRRQQREAAAFNWGGAPAAAASMPAGPAPQGDQSLPRGLRNNNPLNLTYVSGQPGVQGSDGRFGRYNSLEEGVAAAVNQLNLYGQRGLTTLEQIIGRWAPPNENNTGAYVANVSRALGIAPNAQIDLRDPAVVGRLVGAMAQMENGRPLDAAVIQRGVAMGLGGPRPAAPAASPDVTPASASGGAPVRAGIDPAELRRIEMGLASPNEMIRRAAQARLQTLQLAQRDPTDSYREETRTIGGREVRGQVNTRTGQFHPFPGQTGTGGDDITPSRAAGIVAELGPRVARGEITPDSPEYNRYAIAHGIATRPQQVWADDPSQPGTQRQFTIPGLQLDPARFPPPAGGVAPQGGPTMPIQDGAAPAAPAAVPAASGGVQIGATGMSAEPPDATAVNPAGLTRQAPNSTPTGEENLSAGYARRMVEAEGLLAQAVARGYVPGNLRDAAAGAVAGGRDAGFARRAAGNAAMSTEGQLYRQAQEDWVRAKLRRESGAVIGEDEMAREIQVYFPQPGDSQAVIAQKSEARRVAADAMRQGAGRAAATVPTQASPPDGALRRRGEEALARARRELGAGASDDAILQRARGYMQ